MYFTRSHTGAHARASASTIPAHKEAREPGATRERGGQGANGSDREEETGRGG